MGVDDVGFEAEIFAKLQAGAGEEGEAAGVVGVVAKRGVVVEPPAIEVLFELDEVNGHAVHVGAVDGAPFLAVAHPDAHRAEDGLDLEAHAVDRRVKREDDHRLMAELAQRLGKGADDIGEPAGFGVGYALGREHQDIHAENRSRVVRR